MTPKQYQIKIKAAIRKNLKKEGSHVGTVKAFFNVNFPDLNFDDYREFVKAEIQKRYDAVATQCTMKKNIRFQ